MRVLVTGGAGFIGRHLTRRLLAEGHQVVLFDIHVPSWDAGSAAVVKGDVRDPAAVAPAVDGVDTVFHLAAAHHDSGIAEATYFDVNRHGMEVVCDAMTAQGVRELVFLSSVAALGDVQPPRGEQASPKPSSPYGRSKLAAEGVVRAWTGSAPDRHALVLRPVVVFGPHNFGNMYNLIRQIARGWYVQLGPGSNYKSLLYVDNLIEVILRLWTAENRPAFELYHVVDKPDLRSSEIAAALNETLGRGGRTISVPVGVATALTWPFELFARALGREPVVTGARIRKFAEFDTTFESQFIDTASFPGHVSLERGLHQMAAWFANGGATEPVIVRRPPREIFRAGTTA